MKMDHQFYKETNFKEVVLNDEVVKIPEDWEVVKLKDYTILNPSVKKSSILDANKDEFYYIPMEKISENKIYCDYTKVKKDDLKTSNVTFPGNLLLAKITPSFENGK